MTITVHTDPDRRSRLTPTSPAQWAYAAMCGVLLLGFVVATPGVPSMRLGQLVVSAAALLFVLGGLIERSPLTVVGGLAGLIFGNYVVVTAAGELTYSHHTLLAQLAGLSALALAVGWAARRMQASR